MLQIIYDVNAYVEEHSEYQADAVQVKLDEETLRVTVYPVDTEGKILGENSPIVDRVFEQLQDAINYYENLVNQLEQLDIIRNV